MVWLGKYTTRYGDYFYFVFRVIIGIVFTLHGAQKLFGIFGSEGIQAFANNVGLPLGIAYIPAVVEFFGGILIIIGLLTRWAALLGAINMIFAWFIVHVPNGWNPLSNFGEPAVLLFASFLMILVYGARKWGLDKVIFHNVW